MDSQHLEQLLTHRNVKPTAVRMLVIGEMLRNSNALSLSDLEGKLGTVDKSSIFRALSVFLGHHVVHQIDDGTGQMKYAVCKEDCHCGEDLHNGIKDEHLHFHCEHCGHTYCLPGFPVPEVELPEGFHAHSANLVFKGICPECHHKGH